jgi:uncharacterized membrane protein YdbT with pleckstrin-like domain
MVSINNWNMSKVTTMFMFYGTSLMKILEQMVVTVNSVTIQHGIH